MNGSQGGCNSPRYNLVKELITLLAPPHLDYIRRAVDGHSCLRSNHFTGTVDPVCHSNDW